MRIVGLTVTGLVGGGFVGIVLGVLLVWLWFGLGLPMIGDDPKGLQTLVILIGGSLLASAVVFAVWLVGRDRRGRRLWPLLLPMGVATLLVLTMWGTVMR